MEGIPFFLANNSSSNKEIPTFYMIKVYYDFHKSLPVVSVLIQIFCPHPPGLYLYDVFRYYPPIYS
jgi:hypothetical protein